MAANQHDLNGNKGFPKEYMSRLLPRPCVSDCQALELKYQIDHLKGQVSSAKWEAEILRCKLANTRIAMVMALVFSSVGLLGLWFYVLGAL